jgi:hypothetical protein
MLSSKLKDYLSSLLVSYWLDFSAYSTLSVIPFLAGELLVDF